MMNQIFSLQKTLKAVAKFSHLELYNTIQLGSAI